MRNMDKFIEVNGHDSFAGRLRKVLVSPNKTYSLSAGEDGLLFVYQLNLPAGDKLIEYQNTHVGEDYKVEEVDKILSEPFQIDKAGIEVLELDRQLPCKETNVDVDAKTALSLQRAKLQLEEDAKQKQAMSKKEMMKHEVDKLRQEYEKIVSREVKERRSDKEFDDVINVDHEYFDLLSSQINAQIQEVCKELEYDKAKHKVAVEKLRAKYLDPLECGIVTLKGIKSAAFVRTFRLTKLAEFVENGLKEQEELAKIESMKKDKLDITDESVDPSMHGMAGAMGGTQTLLKTKTNLFHLEPIKEKEM